MLVIVRHGRTPANAAKELLGRRDPDLDHVGRAQAAAIATVIPLGSRVISSPLQRCLQTAEGFCDQVEVDERLLEINYGELEGTLVTDVPAATLAQWRGDNTWKPAGGESHDELAHRVWDLLDELAEQAAREDVVLVSHVSPIKAAVAWALEVPIDILWRCFVAQASILRIGVSPAGRSLRSFNETSHLAKEKPEVLPPPTVSL